MKETEIKTYNGLQFKMRKGFWDEEIIDTEMKKNEYFVPNTPKVVIDIGAHIGGTALKCAAKGAEVYAFEPQSENFQLLSENVALNDLKDRVHCFQLAVGTNGKINLNPKNSGGFGSYAPEGESETAQTITLGGLFSMCNIQHCDLLKLDCEGAEYDILSEIEQYQDKISQISMELHFAKPEYYSPELKTKFGDEYVANLKKTLGKFYKVEEYKSASDSSCILICRKEVEDKINFFGFHTTTKAQRDMMMYERPFELIDVNPKDLTRFPQIIWDQDRDVYYEFSIQCFLDTFKMFDELKEGETMDLTTTPIWKEFSYKGDAQMTRLKGLYKLYNDIKLLGIKRPICVERTGERFDGSYRTMMAIHLGIPRIQAQFFTFDWRDMNEEYLRRKLIAHEKAFGTDYYQFEFKPGMWNVSNGGGVYQENAKDRWDVISPILGDLTGKTVLDLGCNEGYMASQSALKGGKVIGYEYDSARVPNAWLNKLIFEWVNGKDLDVKFIQKDFTSENLPKADWILMLNVIYHVHDRAKQLEVLNKLSGKMVVQCNLRKNGDRENYYGAHPDDMIHLLNQSGWKVLQVIDWRDKPIIVAEK